MLLFKREDYLFTFDLKSGYHHVDVHEKHWTYLGFERPGGMDYPILRVYCTAVRASDCPLYIY